MDLVENCKLLLFNPNYVECVYAMLYLVVCLYRAGDMVVQKKKKKKKGKKSWNFNRSVYLFEELMSA